MTHLLLPDCQCFFVEIGANNNVLIQGKMQNLNLVADISHVYFTLTASADKASNQYVSPILWN